MVESGYSFYGKKIIYFNFVFLSISFLFFNFFTKIFGFIDVAMLVSFLGFLYFFVTRKNLKMPRKIYSISFYLLFLSIYAGFISCIYGVQEIIFFAKFFKTLLLFVFLFFLWLIISARVDYFDFLRVASLAIVFHSLIIIFCILSPDFREMVYSFTGYQPRGPGWSRSPGLTVSFNATAIVHIVGLWFLISRKIWPSPLNFIFMLIVFFSLIFLGRSMAFLGIVLLLFFYILNNFKSLKAFLFLFAVVLLSIFFSNRDNVELIGNDVILANYDHFVDPVAKFLSHDEGGLENVSKIIGSHYVFSDDVKVLLFGNSFSGHIGILDQYNSTDSDVGLINSINANGLFITLILYFFYIYIIWDCRRGDWQTVFIISLMSIALTFKETGFFASHVTSLLFLVYFYNSTFNSQNRDSNVIRKAS
ncbi:MAG: hypothetical protein COW76_19035 [Shewanella sp. CG18_big_fil_WC_8_21_14_2_50_42_11]|uniref:hypothetical protein n=1 Tax=Shewanella sp. CG18_big_fil_WC_8_21_14_2_50_42_11 TaxID=1975538 RepID=UPI000C3FB6BC|nr:hypothetical protein [Shewanella sp. CG18_big_fil_WC_8_21_14_2_50_42_11]PIP98801.1 MAG: hypothetical protein COW76_19035 [Shewanella sp. CG18_big_fil_WC_8_21_14_2_50_42_11]